MTTTDTTRRKARIATDNSLPSKTVQSDVNRAEIRHIVQRFEATGIVDHMRDVDLKFEDITDFSDYGDAMQKLKEAERRFMELPSKLREVFNHNVGEWLDTAHDQAKFDALRPQFEKLGLLEPATPPATPPTTPPATPPTTAPATPPTSPAPTPPTT